VQFRDGLYYLRAPQIGDLEQLISERELFDVVVCAGRDVSMEEIHQLCETIRRMRYERVCAQLPN
jgi:hypothetical protein